MAAMALRWPARRIARRALGGCSALPARLLAWRACGGWFTPAESFAFRRVNSGPWCGAGCGLPATMGEALWAGP